MRRYFILSLIFCTSLGGDLAAQADPYAHAPRLIIEATLSDMTSPPSYNFYFKTGHMQLDPIDIWYRLAFDSTDKISLATPVFSTRNDSALIRSTTEGFLHMPILPSRDSAGNIRGALIRIGWRPWTGNCVYETVPSPAITDTQRLDSEPEFIHADSVSIPKCYQQPGVRAHTRVRYYVNETGDVCSADIWQSSGRIMFDLYALDVVENWHFRPAIVAGKPVGTWLNSEVSYRTEPHR